LVERPMHDPKKSAARP